MSKEETIFTPKSEGITDLMEAITGRRRESGHCVMENVTPEQEHSLEFRTPLDRKEYSISGLCQTCQDAVFGQDEEDDDDPDLDMGFDPDYNVGE